MERKTKIEITLAVIILILFGLALWWWSAGNIQVSETEEKTTGKIPTSQVTTQVTEGQEPAVQAPVIKETSAITVARTFVERVGSYSSEADAANIDDILSMATASFQKQLESLARQSRSSVNGGYYGISTLVITAPKVVSASDTQTTLSMTTQREETVDAPGNTTVRYQDISVSLVKSGTTWLVDGYAWSE